jgi:hypothetical protein
MGVIVPDFRMASGSLSRSRYVDDAGELVDVPDNIMPTRYRATMA